MIAASALTALFVAGLLVWLHVLRPPGEMTRPPADERTMFDPPEVAGAHAQRARERDGRAGPGADRVQRGRRRVPATREDRRRAARARRRGALLGQGQRTRPHHDLLLQVRRGALAAEERGGDAPAQP